MTSNKKCKKKNAKKNPKTAHKEKNPMKSMEKTFFSENHLGIDFQNCFQLLIDFRGFTSIFPISSAAFALS